MTANVKLLTIDDYLAQPPVDAPTELLRGRLVVHPFRTLLSGCVLATVMWQLSKNRPYPDGKTYGPVGVIARRTPDSLIQADASYCSTERSSRTGWNDYFNVSPEIVFLVLSSEADWFHALQKTAELLHAQAVHVCVVEPIARTVHHFRQDAPMRIAKDHDELRFPTVLPEFSCQVADLFEDCD